MKKFIVAIIFMGFTLNSTVSKADSDSVFPLGYSHVSVHTGTAIFTDDNVDNLGVDDGNHSGVAIYVSVNPRLYLGAEVSFLEEESNSILGKIELELMPVEINLKYSKGVNEHLVLDLGGGVSKTFIEEKITSATFQRRSAWQHGLQAFAGINLLMSDFFAGFSVKWQTMDDFKASSYDYNNIRLDFRLGMMF